MNKIKSFTIGIFALLIILFVSLSVVLVNQFINYTKELNENKTTEKNHQNNNVETNDVVNYEWDGVYSNGNIELTICKFEGYVFVYDTNQAGVRIFGVKNENTIEFGTDYKMEIKKDGNSITLTSDGSYKHYEGTYTKKDFDNTWSGDYYLNGIDLRLRQVDNNKVFYRIIKEDENKEYYEFATIDDKNNLNFNVADKNITISKNDEKVNLFVENMDSDFFLGNINGTYEMK